MRKSNTKKVAIAMLSCCAVACLSVGVITAGAEDITSVVIADESSFYVVEGASVLLKTSAVGGVDSNGMRFTFEMSEAQYKSLLVDSEAETKAFKEGVSVGALVVPTLQIGENETGETVTTDDVVNCTATATQEIPFAKWIYADSEIEGKEEKVYYACAYLYNLPAVAYDAEISACAYITTNEGTVYTNTTTRTMSYVAGAALESGEYESSETVLKGYIPTISERLYSIDDATLDLSDLKGVVTAIKDKDGNSIMSEQNGNVANISGDDVLNSETPTTATGATETVTVYTTKATYNVPLKVCTDVINSAEEFDEMRKFLVDTTKKAALNNQGASQSGKEYCQEINGYYALGNDIDFSIAYPNGYASPFSYADVGYQATGDTHGWNAVFDGNGYRISNLKIIKSTVPAGAWSCSLFGVLHSQGTIKNVAFIDCSLSNDLYGGAFLANMVCGTIENVFMDITLTTSHTNASGNMAFVGQNNTRGVYAYADISNVTVIARGLGINDYVMKGSVDGIKGIKGSFVVIGVDEAKIHNQYTTIADLTTTNSNIKAYTNTGKASQDATLTACGSTAFVNKNGVYTINWNGATVYEDEIVFELAQQLYSIDDATIDISGVSGAITGITDASGNAISYTLDGTTATLSGDDVLNSATPTSATGAIETITVSTALATYNIPLKVCTDVINSATEFDEMKKFLVDTTVAAGTQSGLTYCKKIVGYYALGNDIDFADGYADGYNSPFSYMNVGYAWNESIGWCGTFDGNGYVIRNLKIVKTTQGTAGAYSNSLFGAIANGATVKNIAFENASVATDLYGSAVFANGIFGTVDNIYIEATLGSTKGNNFAFAGLNTTARGVVSYAKISNVTIVVNGLGATDYVMGGASNGISGIKASMVVIGNDGTKVHSQYTTLADLTTANSNIKVYDSEADVTATACGLATFATADNKFIIKWNGKSIYEANLATA